MRALLAAQKDIAALRSLPLFRRLSSVDAPSQQQAQEKFVSGLHAPQLPTPVEVKLRRSEKRLNLAYSDGKQFSLPAELLRACSPSADNQRPGRVLAGRRHVGIMGLQPVGRYAVRIQFDDLHHTGLYTWELLYDIGSHKLSRAKRYIQQLRAQGLSREPARRRSDSRGSVSDGKPGKAPSEHNASCGGGHHHH